MKTSQTPAAFARTAMNEFFDIVIDAVDAVRCGKPIEKIANQVRKACAKSPSRYVNPEHAAYRLMLDAQDLLALATDLTS